MAYLGAALTSYVSPGSSPDKSTTRFSVEVIHAAQRHASPRCTPHVHSPMVAVTSSLRRRSAAGDAAKLSATLRLETQPTINPSSINQSLQTITVSSLSDYENVKQSIVRYKLRLFEYYKSTDITSSRQVRLSSDTLSEGSSLRKGVESALP